MDEVTARHGPAYGWSSARLSASQASPLLPGTRARGFAAGAGTRPGYARPRALMMIYHQLAQCQPD